MDPIGNLPSGDVPGEVVVPDNLPPPVALSGLLSVPHDADIGAFPDSD